jgi:hypothetical protein
MLWESTMKVNDATIEVVGKELRWMPNALKGCWEFQFSVVDLETLSLTSQRLGWYPDSPRLIPTIFLVNRDGVRIGRVGESKHPAVRRDWSWRRFRLVEVAYTETSIFTENVEQALKRIEGASETRFILEYSHVYGGYGGELTVHKVPKNVKNIHAWIGQKSDEAQAKIAHFLENT